MKAEASSNLSFPQNGSYRLSEKHLWTHLLQKKYLYFYVSILKN